MIGLKTLRAAKKSTTKGEKKRKVQKMWLGGTHHPPNMFLKRSTCRSSNMNLSIKHRDGDKSFGQIMGVRLKCIFSLSTSQ